MYVDKKLTELAEELVRACFATEELKPFSIGYVAWFPKVVDIIFDTNQLTLIESLIEEFWLEAIRTSNRSVAVIDRSAMANFASPRVMVVGSEAAPEYLIALKTRLKNNDVLFVCLHDHVLQIQAHFPDSTIINAEGWNIPQVTEAVVNHVKAFNGLLEVA
jgi:hypothetical protein